MNNEIQSVTVYASFVDVIDNACRNDAEKGKMYSALMHYALFGEEPELPGLMQSIFAIMRPAIDKSKMRKIAGKMSRANAKQNGEQNESKTKANDVSNDVSNKVENHQQESEFGSYQNNISTSISKSNSNSLSETFSYPQSVDDVLQLAQRAGCVITQAEAEKYFIVRMSSDWVDAAGRKIAKSRLGYDLKKWQMNSANKPKTREVGYDPKF